MATKLIKLNVINDIDPTLLTEEGINPDHVIRVIPFGKERFRLVLNSVGVTQQGTVRPNEITVKHDSLDALLEILNKS